MISIYKIDNIKVGEEDTTIYGELRGKSTDTKPTEINGKKVGNGCAFIEIDTGKISFFDADSEEWKEE